MCGSLLYTVCMSESAKSVRLDMRISPEDKDLFQRAAEKDGRSVSNWIRDRLLKAAREELRDKKAPAR
jgi:uncharacterized protein (DUF1778 family)